MVVLGARPAVIAYGTKILARVLALLLRRRARRQREQQQPPQPPLGRRGWRGARAWETDALRESGAAHPTEEAAMPRGCGLARATP